MCVSGIEYLNPSSDSSERFALAVFSTTIQLEISVCVCGIHDPV